MLKRYRLVIVNVLLLMALGGSLYGKRIESAEVKKTDFLNRLDLPFRDWKYENQVHEITPREMELLEPDDLIVRSYYPSDPLGGKPNLSQQIQLAVIAGHRKKTVHTPGFCMAGGGWETITQRNSVLPVGDKQIPISRSVMSKEGQVIVVSYFFTDGAYCTPSLTRFQLSQLFKRFGTGIPLGALVRIFAPVSNNQSQDQETRIREAEAKTAEFANATLPKVLQALRETKLEAK